MTVVPVLDLPQKYLQQVQALLREHVPGMEVWVYGSRVTDGGHEASDLDLVLRNPVDPHTENRVTHELKEAFIERLGAYSGELSSGNRTRARGRAGRQEVTPLNSLLPKLGMLE